MDNYIHDALIRFAQEGGNVVVLTGAGISAESAVPTFRGPDGYWQVGSEVYQPQEMATHHMFTRQPDQVWQWYLYRLAVCARAQPNAGHEALVAMERQLSDRFILITQNVDGLHLRAGSSLARTCQIHGNLFYMRCADECHDKHYAVPLELRQERRDNILPVAAQRKLRCPVCGGFSRPHVLWFDETYNDRYYFLSKALTAARRAAVLIVVGTSGATNLPNQIVHIAAQQGALIIDINVAFNRFSQMALQSGRGYFIKGSSGELLPLVARCFEADPKPAGR